MLIVCEQRNLTLCKLADRTLSQTLICSENSNISPEINQNWNPICMKYEEGKNSVVKKFKHPSLPIFENQFALILYP